MNKITRELLIDMICPTKCIFSCTVYNSENCKDCHEELNKLLDAYDNHINAIMIDKFMFKALEMLKAEQDTRYGYLDCMDIREIAKELRKECKK